MLLVIDRYGFVHGVYSEAIDLKALGMARITRASHVEPDAEGMWWADLTPAHGPRLGAFALRSQALEAEQRWLNVNWLGCSPD